MPCHAMSSHAMSSQVKSSQVKSCHCRAPSRTRRRESSSACAAVARIDRRANRVDSGGGERRILAAIPSSHRARRQEWTCPCRCTKGGPMTCGRLSRRASGFRAPTSRRVASASQTVRHVARWILHTAQSMQRAVRSKDGLSARLAPTRRHLHHSMELEWWNAAKSGHRLSCLCRQNGAGHPRFGPMFGQTKRKPQATTAPRTRSRPRALSACSRRAFGVVCVARTDRFRCDDRLDEHSARAFLPPSLTISHLPSPSQDVQISSMSNELAAARESRAHTRRGGAHKSTFPVLPNSGAMTIPIGPTIRAKEHRPVPGSEGW